MAIITTSIKKQFLSNLLSSVNGDSDNYYVAIGRSETWNDSDTTETARNTLLDERQFRLSMQSMKKVENVSFVVPYSGWSYGTIYSAYDDNQQGYPENNFYVINSTNDVYVCLEQGRTTSGAVSTSKNEPSGQSTSAFTTADGYTWKYLYSLNTDKLDKFLTANYMPVQFVDSDVGGANDALQKAVYEAAVGGEIVWINVTSGGSGYTSAPTVVIEGENTTKATATATVSGGQVTKVEMSNRGAGYDAANVTFTGGGGSGATARAIISNRNGIGYDPIDDLKSNSMLFNVKTEGLEGGDFIVDNDFRQIGLVKNPKTYDDSDFTSSTAMTLNSIIVTSSVDADTFTDNQTITGSISGSQAIVDYIDSDTIYFHQNDDTGFGVFDSDVGSSITAPGASATVSSINTTPDVDRMSGKILYLENRQPITRNSIQAENHKLIIRI